jgi:RNA polymerase sigma factor (sigma-70 family)
MAGNDEASIAQTARVERVIRRDAEATLAAALLAGEPGAARLAVTQLSPLVRRVVRRYFGSGPDQQDLCQEVFLRFFARIHELRDRRALCNFLIGISLGVSHNARRRARARSWIHFAANGELPDCPVGPSDLEAREAMARFHRILAGVSAADRALFVARHVEKRELADIAAASGWALATTKRRVARVTLRVGLRMRRDPSLSGYVDRLLPARA